VFSGNRKPDPVALDDSVRGGSDDEIIEMKASGGRTGVPGDRRCARDASLVGMRGHGGHESSCEHGRPD
jgi:hypothetical protein